MLLIERGSEVFPTSHTRRLEFSVCPQGKFIQFYLIEKCANFIYENTWKMKGARNKMSLICLGTNKKLSIPEIMKLHVKLWDILSKLNKVVFINKFRVQKFWLDLRPLFSWMCPLLPQKYFCVVLKPVSKISHLYQSSQIYYQM